MAAIQGADSDAAFDWLINSGRGSVFLVQICSPGGVLRAVAVKKATNLIVNGSQDVR